MPNEPAASRWTFPDLRDPDVEQQCDDLVAIGADLAAGTLLQAYRNGLFPMPDHPGRAGRGSPMGWWSPVRRGVLPLDALRISRSLRQSVPRFEIRVDTAFARVVSGCATPDRSGGWIDRRIASAYLRLHQLGHAHSVEAWQDGALVGGLYGVALGGLFAGESMFHTVRDASKVALVALVEMLRDEHAEDRLLDVQWATDHLASLGVVEVERPSYLLRLDRALPLPVPPAFRVYRGLTVPDEP